MTPGTRFSRLVLVFVASGIVLSAAAQTVAPPPAETAQELVRKVIAKELAEEEKPGRYIVRLRRETPDGSWARDIVDTRDGLVARVVAVNDQPPNAEERAKDDQRLEKLLRDPGEQRKRKERQEKDEEQSRRLIRALPDAFLSDYDGTEPGPHGDLVRLKLRRNPQFDPPSRETIIYKGMEGTMVVEPRDLRVVRIDATLVEDATLGWGFLARLYKGGRFTLEQSLLPGGDWVTTHMTLDFTGKAFLFKTIRINQKQSISDFRPAPTGLSLAEGIELLKKQEAVAAEKK